MRALQGNPGKRPINRAEPKPPPSDGRPPAWLRGRGRKAWRWLAPMLADMRVLTAADQHALALLCDAYAEYIECRQVVRSLGSVYESKVVKASTKRVTLDGAESDGDPPVDPLALSVIIRPRPEVAMASDAWRRVHRMMVEFGLTPSARSKVQAAPEEETDPFADFLNRGSSTNG